MFVPVSNLCYFKAFKCLFPDICWERFGISSSYLKQRYNLGDFSKAIQTYTLYDFVYVKEKWRIFWCSSLLRQQQVSGKGIINPGCSQTYRWRYGNGLVRGRATPGLYWQRAELGLGNLLWNPLSCSVEDGRLQSATSLHLGQKWKAKITIVVLGEERKTAQILKYCVFRHWSFKSLLVCYT